MLIVSNSPRRRLDGWILRALVGNGSIAWPIWQSRVSSVPNESPYCRNNKKNAREAATILQQKRQHQHRQTSSLHNRSGDSILINGIIDKCEACAVTVRIRGTLVRWYAGLARVELGPPLLFNWCRHRTQRVDYSASVHLRFNLFGALVHDSLLGNGIFHIEFFFRLQTQGKHHGNCSFFSYWRTNVVRLRSDNDTHGQLLRPVSAFASRYKCRFIRLGAHGNTWNKREPMSCIWYWLAHRKLVNRSPHFAVA